MPPGTAQTGYPGPFRPGDGPWQCDGGHGAVTAVHRTSQIDGYGSIESGLFSDMGGVKMVTNCEFCAFYVLDEDGYGECEVNMDEDEMARFLSSSYQTCPFYQSDDEYKIVRKQN